MGLETASFIHQLNTSNPVSTDGLAQADDHIRLIKSAIQATFPNVAGAVTSSHSDLNKLDAYTGNTADLNLLSGQAAASVTSANVGHLSGVTSNIQTQLDGKVPTARTLTAGTGLSGGGSLAANRTISHADTSSQASVNNSGNTFIQDITLDGFGHITNITSAAASFSGLTVSASDFTGTDGYIKFSNNFMIQWGQKTPTSGTTTVSFSPAFGTICVWACAQQMNNSQNYQATAVDNNFSTTGMTVYNDTEEFLWLAMGI